MFNKRMISLMLAFVMLLATFGALGTSFGGLDAAQAAEAENIAFRRPAYAYLFGNVPGMADSVNNTSWASSNTSTSLPSYDETAMMVTDGIIGDTTSPLAMPTISAMNINGTTSASGSVAAVTTSNLNNMIDGQSTTTGTATLSASSSAPIGATNPLIIRAVLPKPEKIKAYTFLTQHGDSNVSSKPYSWSLQASNTGGTSSSEWVTVDSYTTTRAVGYGAISMTTASTPFNGMDTRYFDASSYDAFYTYNGTAQATGGVRRTTTCDDYYKYYRLVVTRTNQSSTTSSASVALADFALLAEMPGGGLRNALRAPFISRWTSTASANQWIYIDLGEEVSYDSVKLHWGNDSFPTAYTIQVADDVTYNYGNGGGTGDDAASRWRTVQTVSRTAGGVHEVSFEAQTARYVRINMTARVSGSGNYKLYEFEVFGTRSAAPYENPVRPAPEADGTQELTGGDWTIARAEFMTETGEQMSVGTYDDSGWIPAKVPGTALMSYLKAGIIPDTNFDMNLYQVSDTYFYSDWWYRTSFDIPASRAGQKVYLNFDGINWKAKVFVNGHALGSGYDIEGAYIRGKLDITEYAATGKNYIAVYVVPPEHYSTGHTKAYRDCFSNGGLIGADNPTFHATCNWDWIPTIRGRDTGIYDKVFVTYSGGVDIVDPWVVTAFDRLRTFSFNNLNSNLTPNDNPAYDFSVAHTTLKTEVRNTTGSTVTAVVSGVYNPGGIAFESAPVSVPAGATVPVEINVDIENPDVWWPNTYGDQPLYTASVNVTANGAASDAETFRFGVRELVFTYTGSFSTSSLNGQTTSNSAVNIFCNGVRIFLRGGNWGMDDSNVDLSYEDYRVRLKLHAGENMTMIRNWVGMTGKEAFWDACDEYGILVWDDFWLANPWDGPDPLDRDMFMNNVRDKIRVVRKHPSEALYCARNEGLVARPLDYDFQTAIATLDGTRIYVRSSNAAVWGINGHGPYAEQERKRYFAGGTYSANLQLHTERGQHVIPNPEVLSKYFRPENMWPGFTSASTTGHPWRVNAIAANVWGVHDFFMGGNGPAANFFTELTDYATMQQLSSGYNSIDAFCTISQLPNYDLHRAMFEGFSLKKGSGLLMWMSMSCWPSFAWRTFDYFYDTSSAYFGIKKAGEPLAVVWNPTNSAAVTSNSNSGTYNPQPGGIAVINNTGKVWENLKATANIYSMDGNLIKAVALTNGGNIAKLSVDEVLYVSTAVNSSLWPTNSTKVTFLKLEVFDSNGDLLVDNFYWHDSADTGTSSTPNYQNLQNLPKTALYGSTSAAGSDAASNYFDVSLENMSDSVAMQVRIKATDPATGEMILPVYYSDNYFCMLPGEKKVVRVDIEKLYFDGEPKFNVSGFNVEESEIGEPKDFLILNKVFTIDGVAATMLDDGEVKFQTTIRGNNDGELDVNVLLAVYRNEKLVTAQVVSKKVTLAEGSRETIVTPGITINAGDPGLLEYSVKGFIWDGDYVPLDKISSMTGWVRPPAPDLAMGKFNVASSEEDRGSGNTPRYRVSDLAFDDYGYGTNNRWSSTYPSSNSPASATEWIWVDLGAEYDIRKIELNWEAACARDYTLQVTSDFDVGNLTGVTKRNTAGSTVSLNNIAIPRESTWRTIQTITGNSSSGVKVYTFDTPETARFVRMRATTKNSVSGTYYGYSLFSFKVYDRAD